MGRGENMFQTEDPDHQVSGLKNEATGIKWILTIPLKCHLSKSHLTKKRHINIRR